MRFLVRFANKGGASPADRKQLSKTAYEKVCDFGADVGNLRVSSSAVELDLLLDSEDKLQESLKALQSQIGPLLTLRKLDVPSLPIAKQDAIRLGLDLFDQEPYWESHEALESAWKIATSEEKEILQALILVAAALVHWQKNEKQVTLSVVKRARDKLESHRTEYFGVDLARLTGRLDAILDTGKPEFFKLNAGP
jgi:predicted metal-dependent hydrolase